jgi:hypothetical protein
MLDRGISDEVGSPCHTSLPEISRRLMHLYALILKRCKERDSLKGITQFRSNMELTLQTRI